MELNANGIFYIKLKVNLTGDDGEYLKKLYEPVLNKTLKGDAGFDLYCPEEVTIKAGSLSNKVNLGVSCECSTALALSDTLVRVPVGYDLRLRSSTGLNTPLRLANGVGTIDRGYRGPICAIIDNLGQKDYKIEKGQRITQLVHPMMLANIACELVSELSDTKRGQGGMGSTGK